jgi:RNA polymerase sigma-54 factor
LDYNFDFSHVRSQKLLLIPQLKQAIEILEMNSGELFQYIENQLETNPALEEAPGEAALAGSYTDQYQARSIDYEHDSQTSDRLTEEPERTLSLKQHLLLQFEALCPDKASYGIGEYLIDNTDENGYLKADIAETADFFDVSEAFVLDVLEKLQSLDPPGICARDLKECLMIQLKQQERQDFDAILVVDKYLNAVADDDARYVADATGLSIKRVREAFKKVKSLEPIPGREYCSCEPVNRTLPDIIVQDTKGELQVLYNGEAFPNVCISEAFSFRSSADGEDGRKAGDLLNNAVWLIKCLEQREDIIFAIAQKICECRRDFFRKGPKALKLIDKRSFAASLCLHESLLDKALSGKYLQCRWGMFELKSFFRNG